MTPITCEVIKVHDGDTFRCTNGTRIRVAGIQAPDNTSADPCRGHKPSYVCNDRKAQASKRIMSRITLGKTLTCQPVDVSYNRIVARCTLPDGRSLSCAAIASGAAWKWDSYWRKYGMGRCE